MEIKTIIILALCLVYIIVPYRIDMLNIASAYAVSEEKRDKCLTKVGASCILLAIVPTVTFAYVFATEVLRAFFP